MMMKEEIAEDLCFICKDGGLLLVCEHEHCLKAYHPECVGQDPSHLKENDPWVCSWHSCFICHKNSKFKCFCCPNSVCRACLKEAEFVTVKGEKGFCNNCLTLALLIEDNRDEDSDGGKVDFSDRETYEFLFKEYWEIVKLKENLCPEDIQKANVFLKKGRKLGLSRKKFLKDKDELMSDIDYMEDDMMFPHPDKTLGRSNQMKKYLKRVPSRKTEFIGWGSKVLLNFLTSLGKEVDEPIPESDVYDIVMDYIRENKLTCEGKKRKVACDERLQPLFRRKVVNRNKISDYLESHFVENQMSEEEYLCGSDDESLLDSCKRLKSKLKQNKFELQSFNEKAVELYKNSYASIVMENIKLIYLKRSLVVRLLKNPEIFTDKVVGGYVRVKPEPNDSSVTKKTFQLMQVTGVGRVSEPYKIHDVTTDIALRVLLSADMVKDVPISMISDDDLLVEECENLRQSVNDGLLERPKVGLVDEKARSLHEDITNHWIELELVRLKHLIDRANEKGWRRELNEYMESKELLENQEERSRRLKELPKVIPDTEIECHGTTCQPEDVDGVNEGNENASNEVDEGEDEGTEALSIQKPRKKGRSKGKINLYNVKDQQVEESGQNVETSVPPSELALTNLPDKLEESLGASTSPTWAAGNVAVGNQDAGRAEHEESSLPLKKEESNIIDLHDSDEEQLPDIEKPKEPQVIDIDEDETAEEKKQTSMVLNDEWFYKDPNGETQGPFPLRSLQKWNKVGFFDRGFKVWQSGQDPSEAVLLNVVIQSAFLDA
ncbi:uncharacterized protein At5g08430-like isoform X3 [Aristolochia californica]|uniref:uncharacterized protein At5g08430-like isoform X3 n=1 Tax=Aristolochia californica TaxID=171875 RepID=UPI0035DF176B